MFSIAAISSLPLQIVAAELTGSFLQYWQHRALHRVPLFWETHKFHHSAEQMTTLSLFRETPFTTALNSSLIALPVAAIGGLILPANPTTLDLIILVPSGLYVGFNSINQFLIHSNLNISYGWFGRYFMVSPANHRVHHSILPDHFGKNFSVTLVLWDRVFGTFHEGIDPLSQNCPVGYDGNIYNQSRSIVIEYFYPTLAFFMGILGREWPVRKKRRQRPQYN